MICSENRSCLSRSSILVSYPRMIISRTQTGTHIHTHTETHFHKDTCTPKHGHKHNKLTHKHTYYSHMSTQPGTHTQAHTQTNTCKNTPIHTHTQAHTDIHTLTGTHMHTISNNQQNVVWEVLIEFCWTEFICTKINCISPHQVRAGGRWLT